jgi:hypothetical protein
MKLSVKAMTLTLAFVWGAAIFIVGVANLIWSGYAAGFLKLLASIYPGYQASGTFGDVVVGTLYAVVDGGVFGLVLAWFYNRFNVDRKRS